MPMLKEVAQRANVPLLTAYQVLSNSGSESITDAVRQSVLDAASSLNYRLNITIHDVAAQAGVSIATVSYVLNNSVPVSAPTRERVLQAVAALNYRPNITARNLQASESRMIGYPWHGIMSGQMNAVLDRFVYCIALAAESYGYHTLMFTQPADAIVQPYQSLVQTNRVDGFIISDTNRDDSRIRHLMDAGFPFVAFGQANETWDFPYVDVDGRFGIMLVVNHLLERGHERIAFLGWPEGSLSGDARLAGYQDALSAAGIKPRPGWLIRTQNTIRDGYLAAEQLLKIAEKSRPTAIVCASDVMAIGAMNFAEGHGLRVGEDIAVTGFDDHPLSEFLRPPLTTLHQPIDELAQKIVDLLVAEINQDSVPSRQILMVPTLVVRESSSQKVDKPSNSNARS